MSIPRKPLPSYMGNFATSSSFTSIPSPSTSISSEPSPISHDSIISPLVSFYDHDDETTSGNNLEALERENLMTDISTKNTISTQSSVTLIKNSIRQDSFREKTLKWGSHKRQPILMALYIFGGIVMAVSHHFFYMSLNGRQSGSATRQQWATAIGTGFSFLVIALFRTAVSEAYNQYVWRLVRRRSFKLRSLDKLFAMTSSPVGFFSWELLLKAKIALLLALQVWCMALAGVTPPGTLAVVPGHFNTSALTSWSTFNWSSPNWTYLSTTGARLPASQLLMIAVQAAESMQVVPILPPASNSSYVMQFYGPALKCEPANSTQLPVFEQYSEALLNTTQDKLIMTQSTFENYGPRNVNVINLDGSSSWPFMLQFSAFSRFLEQELGLKSNLGEVDQFNDWDVNPVDNLTSADAVSFSIEQSPNKTTEEFLPELFVLDLWVQTSNESMVCLLRNTSFEVDFEYATGVQRITPRNITHLAPLWLSPAGLSLGYVIENQGLVEWTLDSLSSSAYLAVFISMANMLSGNVTTTISNEGAYNITQLADSSSRVLLTGLTACEDFTNNFWTQNPISQFYEDVEVFPVPTGPVFSNESNIWEVGALNSTIWGVGGPAATRNNYTNDLFTQPAWMCRNRTLARAIEDLSQNITISMLSAADLTTLNGTTVNITYFPTHNMYQYDSRNLILSYAIAIFITLLGASLGLYSFHTNGVSHSMAFSAVVGTTRDPALDVISEYEDKEMMAIRLKLSPVENNEVGKERGLEGERWGRKRLAFVLEAGEG